MGEDGKLLTTPSRPSLPTFRSSKGTMASAITLTMLFRMVASIALAAHRWSKSGEAADQSHLLLPRIRAPPSGAS